MKFSKWLVIAFASLGSLSASSVNLCSDLSSEGNNISGSNVDVTPHPAWAPEGRCGQWVSFRNTGFEGEVVTPNAAIPGDPTAVFFEDFVLGAGELSGSVTVWADDTAAVRLVNSLNPGTGVELKAANPIQDGACADGPIACEVGEGFTITLDQFLAEGKNTLYVDAYQRGGGPFAVMYSGSAQNVIPEPGTYALLGTGLIGLWLARRRRGA